MAELERACANIEVELRERFPDRQAGFLEPVPRSGPQVRQRVLQRYGPAGAAGLCTGHPAEP